MQRTFVIAAIVLSFCGISRAFNITLGAGTLTNYTIASGNVYTAAPAGTTLAGKFHEGAPDPQNTHTLILNGAHDITFNNIVFFGDGIKLDNCTNLSFNDCWIMNCLRTTGNQHAISGGGNVNLVMNRLHIYNAAAAIQLYGGTGGSWTDCVFEKIGYGWKWSVAGVRDVTISRLVIKRCRAMGMEFQFDDPKTDIHVVDCAYAEAERYDDDKMNDGPTMAFSFPLSKGHILVERCYAGGPCWILNADGSPKMQNGQQVQRVSSNSWLGIRVGFEFGGVRDKYDSCWSDRVNDPGAGVTTSPSHGHQIVNCLATGCLELWDFENQDGQADGSALGSNAVQIGGRWQFPTTGRLPAWGGWSLVGMVPPGGR